MLNWRFLHYSYILVHITYDGILFHARILAMARAGITYTEVATAAMRLQKENKATSADNVRNLIGAGSKTTIVKHLNTWKDGHILESQASGVPVSLLEALKGIWTLLKDEATAEIILQEAEATAKIEAIEKVCHRFQEQHKVDQHGKEALEASLIESQHKASDLSALLQAEQIEKARFLEQTHGLERQCTHQSAELARLHDIVKQTQANLEHYQETNLRLKEAHSLERENERNEYLATKHALQSQLNKISQEKAVTDVVFKHSEEALTQANQTITQLQENCTTLEKAAANGDIQNALMEQKNQALLKQVSIFEDQHETLSLKLASAFEQINLLNHKNTGLESAIKILEDKAQGLNDEKLFLMQEKSELLGQIKVFKQQKM